MRQEDEFTADNENSDLRGHSKWMLAPAAGENIWEVEAGSKWGPASSVPPPPSHRDRQVVFLHHRGCHPDQPGSPERAQKGPLAQVQKGPITRATKLKALSPCSHCWSADEEGSRKKPFHSNALPCDMLGDGQGEELVLFSTQTE